MASVPSTRDLLVKIQPVCNRSGLVSVHDHVMTRQRSGTPRLEDDSDLESWIQSHASWLGRCAYLLTHDREEARDLAQETLASVWRARERVMQADSLEAYVLRIMMNRLRDEKRRRRPQPHESDLPDGEIVSDPMAHRDEVDQLMQALQTLVLRQRTVLVLRYWCDLDDSEIARVVGCRRASVRSIAARGLHTLRREMEKTDG